MTRLGLRQWRSLLGLSLLAVTAAYGDVTFRYKTDFKLNASLPEALSHQATQGINTTVPSEIVIQLKKGKGVGVWGGYITITDFDRNQTTLVDTAGKRFATVPLDQFAGEMAKAMPEMPAQAKAGLSMMKGSFQSRATGRKETIHGIQAEEREMTMTLDMPEMPNMPAGPAMKMVMQFWTATASEVARVPAVHEISGYNLWSNSLMNPAGAIENMLQQVPGFGENVVAMMKELRSGSAVLLRAHTDMYMPMLAAMLKALPAGTPNPLGNYDPATPFMQMGQEVAEISTDPIPDSAFALPPGLKQAPMAEIMKDLMGKMIQKQ